MMITPWTSYELAWAQQARADGFNYREIAHQLSRSEWAVRKKLRPSRSNPGKKVRKGDSTAVYLGEREAYKRNALASVWHLIDLKRAGHSPLRTELVIPSEHYSARRFSAPDAASYFGSSSAMCAEG